MAVVAVTGASSGIGRAIARAFGVRGDTVVLIARGKEGLDACAGEIREAGGTALVYPLDVSDRDAVDACANDIVLRCGQLDVWINDAMVSVLGPAWSLSAGELDRVTRVNYYGAVWGTLAALRHMRARGRGVIIQIGSLLAYRSIPMQSAYCASKAALRAFTDSLRSELHDEKSSVKLSHLLVPAVNTPQFDVIRNKLDGHAHPMGGVIYQPEVIARAAVYTADHPVRELWIGPMTIAAKLGQSLVPGLLDRKLGSKTRTAQITKDLPKPSADNLLAPLPGDRGARGSFDDEARGSSLQLWARINQRPLTVAALAAVAAFFWWRRRA